ncbi:MAG: hypothetical protein CMJ90_04410 [Planctomycetes bacterium]|nr:hypothetical protein [Planctomycetota bacterium]
MGGRVLLLAVAVLLAPSPACGQEIGDDPLDPQVNAALGAAMDLGADPRPAAMDVWRACVVHYGKIDPLIGELDRRVGKAPDAGTKLALIRFSARIHRILGDTRKARTLLWQIEPDQEIVADVLAKAEVLDAQGSNKQAVTMYDRLLSFEIDAELRNRALLRKALLQEKKNDGRSPLAAFASEEGRDKTLQNRAAVILALQNEQQDAIKIFNVEDGPRSHRFRQEVRLAEWGIECAEWEAAQRFAWAAVRSAKLKRDRKYALTILVEAYRRDDALEALAQAFAEASDLTDEARQVWIDLLRETGQVEEALRLFRASSGDQFTNGMRRQLLEMCRETGQETVLTEAYARLVREQPRFIEWREGLARYHLEQGNAAAASDVWADYLDATEDVRYRMAAAASLMKLGLDDLAVAFARACIPQGDLARDKALLFLFELHRERGRMKEATGALQELDRLADPAGAVRMVMADAWARLGDKTRSAATLENLKDARGTRSSTPDLEMKLAFLYSEIGEEQKAQALWLDLWGRIDSIPRRRYVEDRLMTVAARLGTLAKIAVEIEGKLLDKTANDRDAGLLVQIYSRVNDPVSATEIIEEYMKQAGKGEADVVAEKARIFLGCHDYYNYEQAIRRLIEIDDPENRADHMRQLAMSVLERGQREEARTILAQLRAEGADTVSEEFEAGVLALAGLREEALEAYRKSLAKHPERVDTWLLVSNTLNDLGQHALSAGMFQYLAATAEKDDLFTIAIDGILNMRDGRQNLGAPDRLVKWARRCAIERVATRPDKLYLYQLVTDLSEEVNDTGMAIRALKAALPVAGEQRTPLLRELMAKAKPGGQGPAMGIVRIIGPGGIIIQQGGGPAGDQPTREDHLMFGRRLLGQGEIVPPDVYIELGDAFLAAGEVVNAARTFGAASQLPEFDDLQRKIASSFEAARYPKEALRVYERILTVESSDLEMIVKVGGLHEQMGRDDLAVGLYKRGLDLYLARKTFSETVKKDTGPPDPFSFVGRSIDADQQQYPSLAMGLLATLPESEVDAWMAGLREDLAEDIRQLSDMEEADREVLEGFPRIRDRAKLLRRVAVAYGRISAADACDRQLLEAFPKDKKLLERHVRFRMRWGYVVSARRIIESSGRSEKERGRLMLLVGGGRSEDLPGLVPVGEAATMVLPLLVTGNNETVRLLLERVDLSTSEKGDEAYMPLLVSTAQFLGESEVALSLLRHWLSAVVTHHQGGLLYAPATQILSSGRRALKPAQFKSLVEGLVQTVVEKPDKFSVFIQRLPSLQKEIGPGLLTTKQVQKLIESRLDSSDRMVYGIPALFTFIPAAERASSLRSIWSKVPKAQRAQFILELVPQIEEDFDPGFENFLIGAFKQAVRDVDDPQILTYMAENLTGLRQGKMPHVNVVLGIFEALLTRADQNAGYRVGKVLCLAALGRTDEVKTQGVGLWRELASNPSKDYQVINATNRLLEAIAKDHGDALLKTVDDLEAERGKTAGLTMRRLELLTRKKDEALLLTALRQAVTDHPDSVPIQQLLMNHLIQKGYRVEALGVQEKIRALQPNNAGHKRRLENQWKLLRHPIRALAARQHGQKDAKAKATPKKSSDKKPRTPNATPAEIKKALDADDIVRAQRIFRRLWRAFPTGQPRPLFGGVRATIGGNARSWIWPADKKAAVKKKPVKRPRGGFPADILDRKIDDQKKAPTPAKPEELEESEDPEKPMKPKRRTLHEVLVDHDFGENEMRRNLRTLLPGALQNASPLLSQLVDKDVERKGLNEAIEALLLRDRQGEAGKLEYSMLFALLEKSAKDKKTGIGATLTALMSNVNAKDTGQLRRMARLYARLGEVDKASILWRWCANAGGGGYRSIDHALLNEVIAELEGEQRDQIVEAILDGGRPGADETWNLDWYYNTVLQTWLRIGGPDLAIAKGQAFLELIADTSRVPCRQACKTAVHLLARDGQTEKAARCLEIAYCKFEVPASGGIDYAFMRYEWERFGYGGYHDFARMFPKHTEGWRDPATWFSIAAEKVEGWIKAERMDEALGMQALAVLAVRLHESGQQREGATALTRVKALAGQDAGKLLWVADVARRLGKPGVGQDIERALLAEGRLHPERVPAVVTRVLETEGAVAALRVGEAAAKGTHHPKLLDILMVASHNVGDEARAAYWSAMKLLSAGAEVALKRTPK